MSGSSQAATILGGATGWQGSQPVSPDPIAQANQIQDLRNKRQQNINAQTENQQAQQAMAIKSQGISSGIAYQMSLDQNLTPQSARANIMHYAQVGLLPPQFANIALQQIQDNMTTQQLQTMFRQAGMSGMPPDVQQRMAGTQGIVNDGAYQIPFTRPGIGMPNAGQLQINTGAVQNQTSPEQRANLVPVSEPGGGSHGEPRSNFPNASGTTGANPPPGANPPSSQLGVTGSTPPGGKSNQTSNYPSLSQPTGNASDLQNSADSGTALLAGNDTRNSRLALLKDIETQANVPGAWTGPDAQDFMTLKSRLAQIPGLVNETELKGLSAQEQMTKIMANLQSAYASSNLNTNSGLAQATAGAPHIEMSKYGLKGVIHNLEGTIDAEQAMANEWQKAKEAGAPANSFRTWQAQFQKQNPDGRFDPQAFWFKRMDPDERNTFAAAVKAKSPAAYDELRKNVQFANDHKLYQ